MKTQMRFQKILTLVSLITAALSCVLALFFCSGVINEAMYYSTYYLGDGEGYNPIKSDKLFTYTQSANDMLVIIGIVLLLVVVVLYITNCNKRRNYYITNYVAIGLFVVYALVFSIIWIVVIANTFGLIARIDFAKWKALVDETGIDFNGNVYLKNPQRYSENCATLILGLILCVVVLAEAAAWTFNLIWKIKLMKGEKALLENGLVEEVA